MPSQLVRGIMKRDILDYLGNKIGELELPDNTAESVWEEKLAVYLKPPEQEFKTITPRQVRLQLLKVGITSEMVISAIESYIPDPEQTLAKIEWEYSIGFERNAPFVDGVSQVLGLTSEQVDNLWLEAAKI